jgi:hypothetical protein
MLRNSSGLTPTSHYHQSSSLGIPLRLLATMQLVLQCEQALQILMERNHNLGQVSNTILQVALFTMMTRTSLHVQTKTEAKTSSYYSQWAWGFCRWARGWAVEYDWGMSLWSFSFYSVDVMIRSPSQWLHQYLHACHPHCQIWLTMTTTLHLHPLLSPQSEKEKRKLLQLWTHHKELLVDARTVTRITNFLAVSFSISHFCCLLTAAIDSITLWTLPWLGLGLYTYDVSWYCTLMHCLSRPFKVYITCVIS